MDGTDALEKYRRTVEHLATTDAPLRDRLIDAYQGHAAHVRPKADGLGFSSSIELTHRVLELDYQMTTAPVGVPVSCVEAVVAMTDDDVDDAVRTIWWIYRALETEACEDKLDRQAQRLDPDFRPTWATRDDRADEST